MSLLPIIKICKHKKVQRLFSQRNVPKHSPIFKLLTHVDQDYLGKYMGRSTTPNCTVHNSIVLATYDIQRGDELTLTNIPLNLTEYLDSI